jgi:hypothetical protein
MNTETISKILNKASQLTGLDPDCITAANRKPSVVPIRDAVFLTLHKKGWPSARIAAYFQGRQGIKNVSSIWTGIERSKKRIETDPEYEKLFNKLHFE